MIPLNKPLVNTNRNKQTIKEFASRYFLNRKFYVSFSARQGLWEIYHRIRKEHGNQYVAVSPLTCVEAIYPIIENGHKLMFIDIDAATLNMNERLIPEGVDIIQAIHFGGNPQNMDLIAQKKPRFIVEDCAQGFGSYYKGIHVGNFGDFSVFSFMKNFYSLGGGLVLLKEIYDAPNLDHKSFGILSTIYRFLKRFNESKLSTNSNFYDYFLAMLMSLKPENTTEILNNSATNSIIFNSIELQLSISTEIIKRRISNALKIISNLDTSKVIPQQITNSGTSNFLRIFCVLNRGSSKEVITKLRKFGIGANHLTQNHKYPYQNRFDFNNRFFPLVNKQELPNYFEYHDKVISIPISPALNEDEIKMIISALNSI